MSIDSAHATANTDHRDLRGDAGMELVDAYWRAANYLSVGQIYLLDNPLLQRAAEARAHQAAAARPLGHDAGPEHALRPPQPGHQAATT